jgi:hypothetical protein
MSKREEAKAQRALAKIAGRGCEGATAMEIGNAIAGSEWSRKRRRHATASDREAVGLSTAERLVRDGKVVLRQNRFVLTRFADQREEKFTAAPMSMSTAWEQEKAARRKLALDKHKTDKAMRAKAEQQKRFDAEMASFEQRERYTLIKRSGA